MYSTAAINEEWRWHILPKRHIKGRKHTQAGVSEVLAAWFLSIWKTACMRHFITQSHMFRLGTLGGNSRRKCMHGWQWRASFWPVTCSRDRLNRWTFVSSLPPSPSSNKEHNPVCFYHFVYFSEERCNRKNKNKNTDGRAVISILSPSWLFPKSNLQLNPLLIPSIAEPRHHCNSLRVVDHAAIQVSCQMVQRTSPRS